MFTLGKDEYIYELMELNKQGYNLNLSGYASIGLETPDYINVGINCNNEYVAVVDEESTIMKVKNKFVGMIVNKVAYNGYNITLITEDGYQVLYPKVVYTGLLLKILEGVKYHKGNEDVQDLSNLYARVYYNDVEVLNNVKININVGYIICIQDEMVLQTRANSMLMKRYNGVYNKRALYTGLEEVSNTMLKKGDIYLSSREKDFLMYLGEDEGYYKFYNFNIGINSIEKYTTDEDKYNGFKDIVLYSTTERLRFIAQPYLNTIFCGVDTTDEESMTDAYHIHSENFNIFKDTATKNRRNFASAEYIDIVKKLYSNESLRLRFYNDIISNLK